MIQRCPNPNCFVHDGETCALGSVHYPQCQVWSEVSGEVQPEMATASSLSARVPWSGSALGLADLTNVAPKRRPILVGLLGAHDAGKTTLLTGNYLQLMHGRTIAGGQFAGSYSLGAWESLAAWVRFEDAARTPSFPPHTPRGTSRIPGLLHLALRNSEVGFRDILLTDAPGEWFTRWAIQEDAPDANGAQWIARNADVFLVFADCERLTGDGRGQTRNNLRQLIERLGNHVTNQPTVLVWAKDDHQPSEGIRNAIRRALNEHIPHAIEVGTSTNRPESLLSALSTALELALNPNNASAFVEPILKQQPFEAFRGHYAHS